MKEASELLSKNQHSEEPNWWNGKCINEVLFCEYFKEKYPLAYVDKKFYSMDGQISEEELEQLIIREISEYVVSGLARRAGAIKDALKYYILTDELPRHEDRIHFANGTYFLDGGFISEKEFCANRLPIDYCGDARCPNTWLNFLNQLLYPEDIATLQEFLGYCLIPTTKAQAMLMIIGSGGEGKSRIGAVMERMLGRNVYKCSIEAISKDKFLLAELMGRLLMIDDDMQMSSLEKTGILKQLITSDGKMSLEIKQKQAFQGFMYARIIAFGNGALDALYDKSDGFYRRQIVLYVKDRPKDRVDDKNFTEKLLAEMDGIVLWLIEGLKRLIANGYHFTISERAKQNLEDSKIEGNSVVAFLNSDGYIGFDKDSAITTKDFFDVYYRWCDENAEVPCKNPASFSKKVKEVAKKYGIEPIQNVLNTEGMKVRGYRGVYIKVRDSENPFLKAS